MKFLARLRRKEAEKPTLDQPSTRSKTAQGAAAEQAALAFLQQQGLRLITRNYRTPGRGGGEIDLVMQAQDGTVVFVEVRQRSRTQYGGAAASIGMQKQRRIILAARHFLQQHHLYAQSPCRFDAVLLDGTHHGNANPQWIQGAFMVE